MNKKRFLAMLLAGAMMLGLAACGGGGSTETPSGGETVSGNSETPSGEGKTVKVGLICIGDENDQGYTYNFIRGKEAVTEKLAAKGITVDWQVKWNIGEDGTSARTPPVRMPTSSWPRPAAT